MSRTKNLIQLIESSEKKEFDEVVRSYLKSEFDFKKIVNTDGKDDTGIDIKIFDFDAEKLQFQLTTQKSKTQAEKYSFEKKLREDLEKAKENHLEYGHSNKLFFFYSYELTNKRIRELEKMAFKEYGINLELIEANRIAEEAENIIEIQRILYSRSKLDKFQVKESLFDNENENLIYDLLSFGKPSEFKMQIIEGFILKTIFENKSLNIQEIIKYCEEKFKVGENEIFYEKLINRLRSSKKITNGMEKGILILTSEEENLVNRKIQQFQLEEDLFLSDISCVLADYDEQESIEAYVYELKRLYTENFSNELNELINSGENETIFSVIKEFIQFIENRISDKSRSKKLGLNLLKVCVESKFIQKIAASKVYCDNINNTRLEKYLNTQKRVFIDTPIALYALCYFYKSNTDYENYFFKTTMGLIKFTKEENIPLFLSERYVWEVRNHIKEAFYLIPFSELDNFQKLGSSRNVFYNFYLYLHNHDSIDLSKSFSEFLGDYGFTEGSSQNSLISKINSHLNYMNISKYELEFDYEIEDTNKIFDENLISSKKFKSPFTRDNDSIMVKFLADKDVEVHPVHPVFLTWDRVFFNVQKEYFKAFPDCQKWLMLPPGKFVDSYAILKFKIDNESVTENLLALISDDLVSNTHSLLDSIKFILNPKNEVSLEYTNKLAKIREDEIHNINRKVATPPEDFEGEAVIDEVFYSLSNYFQDKEDISLFNDFREVFKRKDLMDIVIGSVVKTIDNFYLNHHIDNELFVTFDKLVGEIRKGKDS